MFLQFHINVNIFQTQCTSSVNLNKVEHVYLQALTSSTDEVQVRNLSLI